MDIEYDQAKSDANLRERGFSFEAAREIDWTSALVWEDTRFNYNETRFRGLGLIGDRLYAIAYVWRDGVLRVISMRKANNREISSYEHQA